MWKGGKENSTPNKKVDTAPRKFPNPPQVITTPIKHFFKATPTKPASTTPSKNSFASPVQRISIAAPNRASVTLNRDSIITPTRDSVASNRDSIVVVHSPSFTALQKRVSSPNKSPKFKSPKSKSPKFKSPIVKSPIARESTEPRTPLSPKVRSVSTTPVHEDASRTSIDYYERIYNIGRPSATTPNKEVTLKQSDWHNMLSGLLEQVQEKDEQIADYQEHVEELEDKVDNVKRENILLRDEIREKNAEIARLTVTSGDKGELEALKERLNEVSNLALTQISQLKEFPVDDDREIDRDEDTEEVRVLRRELERAREEAREYSQEVERLSKKITHKNSQLKTYKSKVDTFLGALEARTTPSKNKRRSNGGWAQGERKKSRGSISGRN